MTARDFSDNLRLLCSYGQSVSAICRDAGINRHQMKRYLGGTASPSLHTLRRLCDFFGLEEHEILLPQKEFAALVRIKPPRLQRTRDRISEFVGSLAEFSDLALLQHYVGFYQGYFQPDRRVPEIHTTLTQLKIEDGCLISKTIERHPGGSAGLPRVIKYDGVAFLRGSVLTIIEDCLQVPETAFVTMLYGADTTELTYLSGLVSGTSPDSTHAIYAMRTCWRYLGPDINLRKHLSLCGHYPLDHPSVGHYARFCTTNELETGEAAFEPRM
jgi:transcriptional regulator with XRE-family HTH domain